MADDWERDFVRDELNGLRDSIRAYIRANDTLLSVGIGSFGGLVALAVSQKAPALLLAGPLILTLVYLHSARMAGELLAFGQYRAALEQYVRGKSGVNLLTWESEIAPALRQRPFVQWWQGALAILYGSSVAAAVGYLAHTGLPVVVIGAGSGAYFALAAAVAYVYRSLPKLAEEVAGLLGATLAASSMQEHEGPP